MDVDRRQVIEFSPYLGSRVTCYGTVTSIRYKNPFTKSQREGRQWMVLLTNVLLAGHRTDHIWLYGCKKIESIQSGDVVFLIGRLMTYLDDGVEKIGLGFPYQHFRIFFPDQQQDIDWNFYFSSFEHINF